MILLQCSVALRGEEVAQMRALASYQCDPGSKPGSCVIRGLTLFLVPILAPRALTRVLWFSSLQKNQHFKLQFHDLYAFTVANELQIAGFGIIWVNNLHFIHLFRKLVGLNVCFILRKCSRKY